MGTDLDNVDGRRRKVAGVDKETRILLRREQREHSVAHTAAHLQDIELATSGVRRVREGEGKGEDEDECARAWTRGEGEDEGEGGGEGVEPRVSRVGRVAFRLVSLPLALTLTLFLVSRPLTLSPSLT